MKTRIEIKKEKKVVCEKLSNEVLDMLYEDNYDFNLILEKLGKFLENNQISIVKIDEDNNKFDYIYNWSKTGSTVKETFINNIKVEEIKHITELFKSRKSIFIDNEKELSTLKEESNFSSDTEKTNNIMIEPIYINDRLYGLIMLDNIQKSYKDIKQLKIILSVLSMKLEREYNKKEMENKQDILKNLDKKENMECLPELQYDNLVKSVTEGIKNNEFKLLYQPKFNLKDIDIIGVEALIRWQRENNNIIYPDLFIGKLEAINSIYIIDYFVIEEALKTIEKWRSTTGNMLPISINVSKSTLLRSDFIENLKDIISRYDVPNEYIEVEITERESLGDDLEKLSNVIYKVRELGILVSIDDFGSGHSNFKLISNVSFDYIKVDKSIIDHVGTDEKMDTILRAINKITSINNSNIIAEGIETSLQHKALIKNGYTYGQGYYFSRPIPLDEFEHKYLLI